MMASALQVGRAAACRTAQHDEHRGEIGAVGLLQERHARDGDRVATPGVSRVMRIDLGHSVAWVRSSEAESGSCTLTMSRP